MGAELDQVDLSGAVLSDVQLDTAYCDWATKLPAGLDVACVGVSIQRK